jgi:hypothetical protein
MSGIDNEVFNNLERAVSADLNDMQSLVARFISEMARYGLASRTIGWPTSEFQGPVVLGGLTVIPSGTNVAVEPGMMAQLSATLAPTPGPLDSPYRLSRLATPTVVTMPSPGTTTYYLIEAQMVEVTTVTTLRDVWTPPAGPFAPASVPKQRERRIQFQVIAGNANAPEPSGGDWVPIAIVRRPGGGGPVLASDIIDVRPLAGPRYQPVVCAETCFVRTSVVFPAINTATVRASFSGPVGQMAYVGQTVDLSATSVRSPSTTLAADQPYYLYLAPWSLSRLPVRQQGSVLYEGVLVLSHIPPTSSGTNSAALTLPPPFGATQVSLGNAYYVATVIRDSGNTGWVGMVKRGNEVVIAESYSSALGTTFAPPVVGDNPVPPVATFVPPTARTVRMRTRWIGAASSPTTVNVRYQAPGTSDDLTLSTMDDSIRQTEVVDVPYTGTGGLDMTVSAANAGTTASAKVIGWRE